MICQYQECEQLDICNVEGSNTAAVCKQHALGGMVDVYRKRCIHDSCTKQALFSIEGSQTPVHCTQHAEGGMVDVQNKQCSRAACTQKPYFGFDGSNMPVYCKQHALDGMADVRNKSSLRDSCARKPSYRTNSRRTQVPCKQHAEDAMVDVERKQCSKAACAHEPLFCFDGGKIPVYCARHALDGMVDVRTTRYLQGCLTTGPARGLPTNAEATTLTRDTNDILDGSVNICGLSSELVTGRKRSRVELERMQSPLCVDHVPVKQGEAAQCLGMRPGTAVPHTSYSSTLPRNLNHGTVKTDTAQSSDAVTLTLTPLTEEPQPGPTIKTELEVVVSL